MEKQVEKLRLDVRNEEVRFLHHGPCPACGSRDNLGTWSDGHSWCFGCGYRTGGTLSFEHLRTKYRLDAPGATPGVIPLPEDVSTFIPEVPYHWLKQWLTDGEILKHRIGWSQAKEAVVFPIFDPEGKLLMWQSRYFGENKNYPKYLTKGHKGDILHILGEHPSDRVVLVEDLISAIVVSRKENAMPLWGSTIHLKTLKRLARNYGHLVIWLDADKLEVAIKAQGPARLLFQSVQVVRTDDDPKYQSLEQLEKILGEGIDKRD